MAKLDSVSCQRCQAEIDTRFPRPDGTIQCPICGLVYQPVVQQPQPAQYPYGYGSQQPSAQKPSSQVTQHRRSAAPAKKKNKIWLAALAVAVIAALGAVIFFIASGENGSGALFSAQASSAIVAEHLEDSAIYDGLYDLEEGEYVGADAEKLIPISVYSSSDTYSAGEPIVFNVDILGGTPPFTVNLNIEEGMMNEDGAETDLTRYLEKTNYAGTSASITTSERHLTWRYTPPANGLSLVLYASVQDAKNYGNLSNNDAIAIKAAASYGLGALEIDITDDCGETHTGSPITFTVAFKNGTPPYEISYDVIEEGYMFDPSYIGSLDVEFGAETHEDAIANNSTWTITYMPKDPTKHITFGLYARDKNGLSTFEYGNSIEVHSALSHVLYNNSATSSNALFRIATRTVSYLRNPYGLYDNQYTYTNTFPADFGNNPDYWFNINSVVRTYADKSVSIGAVGTNPREICTVSLDLTDTVIGFCVPVLPQPLKQFADKNGFNVIKMYLKSGTLSQYNAHFFMGDTEKIIFYRDWFEIDPYYDKIQGESIYPKFLKYKIYHDHLVEGEIAQDYVIEFIDKLLVCETVKYDRNKVEIVTVDFESAYYLNDQFKKKDTIIYTDRGIQMSDEEAKWFVDYLESIVR